MKILIAAGGSKKKICCIMGKYMLSPEQEALSVQLVKQSGICKLMADTLVWYQANGSTSLEELFSKQDCKTDNGGSEE